VIPYDSFLLDPPMLFSSGWLGAKIFARLPEDRREKALRSLFFTTMGVFWGTSISLYCNLEWTRWIWELCHAESGRDWMINSGVFHFEHEKPSPKAHALAAAILATYPVWLKLGMKAGSRASA
jgi:hypothetical protein